MCVFHDPIDASVRSIARIRRTPSMASMAKHGIGVDRVGSVGSPMADKCGAAEHFLSAELFSSMTDLE
jgi:hypothetical protein